MKKYWKIIVLSLIFLLSMVSLILYFSSDSYKNKKFCNKVFNAYKTSIFRKINGNPEFTMLTAIDYDVIDNNCRIWFNNATHRPYVKMMGNIEFLDKHRAKLYNFPITLYAEKLNTIFHDFYTTDKERDLTEIVIFNLMVNYPLSRFELVERLLNDVSVEKSRVKDIGEFGLCIMDYLAEEKTMSKTELESNIKNCQIPLFCKNEYIESTECGIMKRIKEVDF